MTPSSNIASAEALLAHESFVRAVVRGLLADDHAVQDVLQETWLRALRRAPRDPGALRPWLASVARNVARSAGRASQRRTARERVAARAEAVESTESAAERVAARREVADAVLELEEPYREVVLMRYEQHLAPGEIAVRLGRSPATVRSQLSRAHARLRERLDERFEGGTRAWGALLVTLPRPSVAPVAVGVALPLFVVGAALVGLGVALRSGRVQSQPVAPASGGALEHVAVAAAPVVGPVTGPAPAELREPAAPAVAQGSDRRKPRLEKLEVEALRVLAWQTQYELEAKLLEVPEFLLDGPPREGAGVTRLLSGGGFGELSNLTWSEGGGSYFSFVTGSHDYQQDPDLSFRGGSFSSGFSGSNIGLLLGLGGLPLVEVPESAELIPAGLAVEREDAWRTLWSEIDDERSRGSDLRQLSLELQRELPAAGPGQTYALRSIFHGRHDVLVAFQVVQLDERGCFIRWRVLKQFPIVDPRQPYPERTPPAEAPQWMARLDADGLLELLGELRGVGSEKLLAVSEDSKKQFAKLAKQPLRRFGDGLGFARVLHRGEWGALLEQRGGGAYFSFLTKSNDYDDEPDLGLEQRSFSSGFAGNDTGLILDLGAVPFSELAALYEGTAPSTLSEEACATWEWLRTMRAVVDRERGRRELSKPDMAKVEELQLRRGVQARVGHSYLLRAALFGSHDHLVVFTVIDEDAAGMTLVWRVLGSWAVER